MRVGPQRRAGLGHARGWIRGPVAAREHERSDNGEPNLGAHTPPVPSGRQDEAIDAVSVGQAQTWFRGITRASSTYFVDAGLNQIWNCCVIPFPMGPVTLRVQVMSKFAVPS
jgi:hypothetical protein